MWRSSVGLRGSLPYRTSIVPLFGRGGGGGGCGMAAQDEVHDDQH